VTTQTEAQNISAATAAVVQKAILEPAFRAALLANPKATIEKVLNVKLPATLNLKVIEATQTEYTVVLPYQAKVGAAGELSDSDLEAVAGGSKHNHAGQSPPFVGSWDDIDKAWDKQHTPMTMGLPQG
jgi:hypothetical protein